MNIIGSWWFGPHQSLDLDPIPATIDESKIVVTKDDSKEPLPPPPGHDKPRCVSCDGPNFSLKKNRCLLCRALL